MFWNRLQPLQLQFIYRVKKTLIKSSRKKAWKWGGGQQRRKRRTWGSRRGILHTTSV
jgi:hypothetical protein